MNLELSLLANTDPVFAILNLALAPGLRKKPKSAVLFSFKNLSGGCCVLENTLLIQLPVCELRFL